MSSAIKQPSLMSFGFKKSKTFELAEGVMLVIDMDNNKIRTEWRINCNYPGPDGFCSLKCENEYKYR